MASEDGSLESLARGDIIDITTFEQILEMDDDDERDFSKSIVLGFFEQAETTFTEMGEALDKGDLEALSQLGHFLKGSSATLGLTKVKDHCEKIQHLGAGKDESGENDVPHDAALKSIKTILVGLRKDYDEAEKKLKVFYKE